MKTLEMMKVEHMTDADIRLLKQIWPLIEKDKTIIVDAFYTHLYQFDEMKRLIIIIEQKVREQKIKGDLKYLLSIWVVGLFSGIYDDNYANGVRRTLEKYIKAGISMKVMLSALGYLRNLLIFYTSKEFTTTHSNGIMNATQAINKVIDLNLLITSEVYMANTHKIVFRSKF